MNFNMGQGDDFLSIVSASSPIMTITGNGGNDALDLNTTISPTRSSSPRWIGRYQRIRLIGASTLSTDNYQVTTLRPALSPWPAVLLLAGPAATSPRHHVPHTANLIDILLAR